MTGITFCSENLPHLQIYSNAEVFQTFYKTHTFILHRFNLQTFVVEKTGDYHSVVLIFIVVQVITFIQSRAVRFKFITFAHF